MPSLNYRVYYSMGALSRGGPGLELDCDDGLGFTEISPEIHLTHSATSRTISVRKLQIQENRLVISPRPKAALVSLFALLALPIHAQITLLAVGTLTDSAAGSNADLSGLTYKLENGSPANFLGGLGSGIAYASGNTFLALPDRGPNAIAYNSAIDDTASYINRFHTINMDLQSNPPGSTRLFTLTPTLESTTLFWSLTPLVYGNGPEFKAPPGRPPINSTRQYYFTGRSDNFDPDRNSGDGNDARFDTEGIRVSNDGLSVFISDEYGPYIYRFARFSGMRLQVYRLPEAFYVPKLKAVGNDEISGNTSGRTANKGMEGLAITPDGKTLVGIMQNALIQDSTAGATKLLRMVSIDIETGDTRQYGYLLTTGSGVSEIVALNNHEFLVDERDGNGRANGNNAAVKQLFKIDLSGAVEISAMDGPTAAKNTVSKTLFLDLVKTFNASGIDSSQIPAKIEGLAFGADVTSGPVTFHTLWVANDNDFLTTVTLASGALTPNPNQFFVFGFTDADLNGSQYVPQQFSNLASMLK